MKRPGKEKKMRPKPVSDDLKYEGSNKLLNKVALITGGDSGIGRAVARFYAREGADIVIVYYNEHQDARETKKMVEEEGRRCHLIAGDLAIESFCKKAVKEAYRVFSKIDILVNNAAVQYPEEDFAKVTSAHFERTFRVNIFSFFYMSKAILPYFKKGGVIINSTSVTAYRGSKHLVDYSATKGAITSFTRSLSLALIDKKIRVNGVAPGPIWTPLITSTFSKSKVKKFGKDTPMKRAGQPEEVAPSYVFLASDDASYISGQILHVNGGEIVNA